MSELSLDSFRGLINKLYPEESGGPGRPAERPPGRPPREKRLLLEHFAQEPFNPIQIATSSAVYESIKRRSSTRPGSGRIEDAVRTKIYEINKDIKWSPIYFLWWEPYVVFVAVEAVAREIRELKSQRRHGKAHREALRNALSNLGMKKELRLLKDASRKQKRHTHKQPSDRRDECNVRAYPCTGLSPFTFPSFLNLAKREILIVGVCLYYVTSHTEFSDRLFEWLDEDDTRVAKILIQRPVKRAKENPWALIFDDLRKYQNAAVTSLRTWISRAEEKGKETQLDIRLCDMVSVGICVVDPNHDGAMLTMSPYVYRKYLSAQRPQFVIFKSENHEIFRDLYYPHEELFNESRRLSEDSSGEYKRAKM